MAKIRFELRPLRELLLSGISKTSIRNALKRFSCKRDEDVESFLKQHAIQNEKNGASRTFLVLEKNAFLDGKLEIIAIVSLALTDTNYSQISEDDKRIILGNIPHIKTNDYFPGYLVAQLARDDRYTHSDFDGSSLLVFAETLIESASKAVGGHLIYLDCKADMLGYYENQGYEELYFDENTGLYKLMKYIGANLIAK